MRLLKALVLFAFTFNVFATIVFLDVNNNKKERETAIKAAKKAGKNIVVYPKGSEKFDYEKALVVLKNNTPETLFLSGHDGGGQFGGDRGESFSRYEIKKFLKESPEVANNIRVLGLLGCNTGSHAEIKRWKEEFPNLAFVAGYDGIAPSGSRPAGWRYIEDVILKSDDILGEADAKKIKEVFESFGYINMLSASLYTTACSENPEEQYIFRPERKGKERFKQFDTAECIAKREEYTSTHAQAYNDYFYGEKEVPQNTSSGPLRDLYTFMRQNEHCFEESLDSGEMPSPDQILFLLFSKDVKENYSKYYGDTIDDLYKSLEDFNDEEKIQKMIDEKNESLAAQKGLIEYYTKNPDRLKAKGKEFIDKQMESLANEYPASFTETYEKATEIFNERGYQAVTEFLATQSDEFDEYVQKRGSLEFYAQHLGNSENMEENLTWLGLSVDDQIASATLNDASSYASDYKALNAKSHDDFKKLTRKELLEDIHRISQMSGALSKYDRTVVDSMNNIPGYLSSWSIPFNWHDSSLGDPADPTDYSLTRANLNRIKNEKITDEELVLRSALGIFN